MSKLPLIHSISTVGVIKHYNQDYLIHDTRTDFTGPNGIGKSLLADLLQILFIAERKKIHFGTDSVKKEYRQIHTIPYKCPNAYFFLNIEVEHQKYITFGVNIPNTSSSQIKIFRILNDHFDAEKDSKRTRRDRLSLEGNLIPEQKLPYFNDFIVNGAIPSLDVLIKHLRDENQLFLDVFTKKNERNELYEFLFNKQILPLNLSQESHLNAFAKVLQAFSKANTLDTDKDESLKNFLFENKKKDIESEYQQNKQNLDDYVERYKNLNALITTLTVKREYLQDLKMLLEKHKKSEKEYVINDYKSKKITHNKKITSWEETNTQIKNLQIEIAKLKKSIPNLETKEKEAIAKFKAYSNGLSQLNSYETKHKEILKLNNNLKQLNDAKLPTIPNEVADKYDFKNDTLNTVLDNVLSLSKILDSYVTIENVDSQFKKQKKNLDNLRNTLLLRKENLVKLIEILDLNNNKSFASKLLQNNASLTLGQETVLRALFLETHWDMKTKKERTNTLFHLIDLKLQPMR